VKRIAFVILQSGPLANGGLQSIGEVMLRLKDHEPVVLTNIDSAVSRSWRDAGIDVRVVREQASQGLKRNPVGTLLTYRRFGRAVADAIASTGAGLVHANDPLSFQLSVLAAKRSGTPILLNLRDTLDPQRAPPRLKFRLIFAAADHVFYLSHDMAERWRQVAGNATRSCSITYSIVDPDRFPPSPADGREKPVVLVPGTFRPKKGQLPFIRDVVPTLAAHGIESWFAGDFDPAIDAYAGQCAAAAAPNAKHVRFLGYRADLANIIAQASVIAVPSRHEGLMRGMIEAMSCGRPVVSFDICSAREVLLDISGGAGAVVNLADYPAMADALVHYATDRRARAEAGAAGSAAARVLFDPQAVVGKYEQIYCELEKH
jgi:glycosyltransferase involved in cell wall biosynthesis